MKLKLSRTHLMFAAVALLVVVGAGFMLFRASQTSLADGDVRCARQFIQQSDILSKLISGETFKPNDGTAQLLSNHLKQGGQLEAAREILDQYSTCDFFHKRPLSERDDDTRSKLGICTYNADSMLQALRGLAVMAR